MVKRKSRATDQNRGIRKPGTRRLREQVCFVVEGKSEQQYLRALLNERYNNFTPHFPRTSGSSLVNLVKAARKEERSWKRNQRGQVIWIVCDVDQNAPHRQILEAWLGEAESHRSALQSVALEGWLLQHQDQSSRPATNEDAFKALVNQWGGYRKGCEIPKWVIKNTKRACQRERDFLGTSASGAWPQERSSQMPHLIAYLDERASQLGSPVADS